MQGLGEYSGLFILLMLVFIMMRNLSIHTSRDIKHECSSLEFDNTSFARDQLNLGGLVFRGLGI